MSKLSRARCRYLVTLLPLVITGCKLIQDLRSRKQNSNSESAISTVPSGPAIGKPLQPVSQNAWRNPKHIGMSREAMCVLSAEGNLACAKMRDDGGMRFVPLNLLGTFDRILSDPRNLCVTRGAETYCKEGSGWFHAMGDSRNFGVFHRTYFLDGKTQLGLIHNDLARWDRNGEFSARATNGVDYTVLPPQDWIAAQSSFLAREGCGLVKSGAVVCYRFPPNDADVVPSAENPKVSLRQPQTLSFARPARELVVSSSYACVRLDDGSVSCWLPPLVGGYENALKNAGQVAPYPTMMPSGQAIDAGPAQREPTPMSLPSPIKALVAGDAHVCALGQDARVYCFGANDWGQLGQKEPRAGSRLPLKVFGLEGVTGLAASGNAVCAISERNGVSCWGDITARPRIAGLPQRKRLPTTITDRSPFDAQPYQGSEKTCSAEQQVTLEPRKWAEALREARDYTTQAKLLEQMRMTPPESALSNCEGKPKVTRVTIDTSPKGHVSASAALFIRADLSLCEKYRAIRTQLLIPISEGAYCAAIPDDIASFDLDEFSEPCRKSPTLGNFAGPLRPRFVTLGSDKYWTLEVITGEGRNAPLAEKSFWYATSYYELRGFSAVELFSAPTFRGRCTRGTDGSAPGIDETRSIFLEGPVPRKLRVEECIDGEGCRNRYATYDGSSYRSVE